MTQPGKDRFPFLSSSGSQATPFDPASEEVETLITRARAHALGTEFLCKGALDAVASTFGVHAFVVDRARETLSGKGE